MAHQSTGRLETGLNERRIGVANGRELVFRRGAIEGRDGSGKVPGQLIKLLSPTRAGPN